MMSSGRTRGVRLVRTMNKNSSIPTIIVARIIQKIPQKVRKDTRDDVKRGRGDRLYDVIQMCLILIIS